MIYTSGSTGQPKGVLVTHANVTWLFANTEGWFAFDYRDIWTLFHSISFDFSVWEFWGALAYGGRLVIVPYRVSRSPEDFYRLLRDERVTVLNQTPSAFRQLIRAEETVGGRSADLVLRFVVFGGEALEPQCLRPWFDRHGDRTPTLINMYGITETTVHVTYRPISRADLDDVGNSGTPIGRAIPGQQVHLLDDDMRQVQAGERGEIFVGGDGVSRGYLNQPELTAQRFLPDPFNSRPGGRLYRSGDLARLCQDGELEYLGRSDDQVKVRGFRIELPEIEAALARCPHVRESVVIAREDATGQKRLIGYVAGSAPDPAEVRGLVAEQLPEHMRPNAIVVLDSLPLNSNGKVDRAALPIPEAPNCFISPAPGDEVAVCVATVWAEVLGREVGYDDNFFDLGGSSIDLVEVHARLRSLFGGDLQLVQLFEFPTIRTFAKCLDIQAEGKATLDRDREQVRKQREWLARRKRERNSDQ